MGPHAVPGRGVRLPRPTTPCRGVPSTASCGATTAAVREALTLEGSLPQGRRPGHLTQPRRPPPLPPPSPGNDHERDVFLAPSDPAGANLAKPHATRPASRAAATTPRHSVAPSPLQSNPRRVSRARSPAAAQHQCTLQHLARTPPAAHTPCQPAHRSRTTTHPVRGRRLTGATPTPQAEDKEPPAAAPRRHSPGAASAATPAGAPTRSRQPAANPPPRGPWRPRAGPSNHPNPSRGDGTAIPRRLPLLDAGVPVLLRRPRRRSRRSLRRGAARHVGAK